MVSVRRVLAQSKDDWTAVLMENHLTRVCQDAGATGRQVANGRDLPDTPGAALRTARRRAKIRGKVLRSGRLGGSENRGVVMAGVASRSCGVENTAGDGGNCTHDCICSLQHWFYDVAHHKDPRRSDCDEVQ